jgi:hypothetical protein
MGTILVCISVVFLAISIAVIEFLEVSGFRVVKDVFRGAVLGYKVIVSMNRAYVWLSAISMRISLITFSIGSIIKIYYFLKS